MIPCLLGWDLKCLPASVFVLKGGAATMLERGHEGREVLEQRGVSPASPGYSSHPCWEQVTLSCSLQLQWSHSVTTQWHRSKPAVYTAHCSNCKTVNKYMCVFCYTAIANWNNSTLEQAEGLQGQGWVSPGFAAVSPEASLMLHNPVQWVDSGERQERTRTGIFIAVFDRALYRSFLRIDSVTLLHVTSGEKAAQGV